MLLGDRIVQPDVLVIGADDVPALAGAARVHGVVPRLVVEVSSPTTPSHDVLRKRRVCEEAGIGEFWFVDLDADRVETYVLAGDRYPAPTVHEPGFGGGRHGATWLRGRRRRPPRQPSTGVRPDASWLAVRSR